MTQFDYLDMTLIVALYAAVFSFSGIKWRWFVTVSILAAHLVMARWFIHTTENPVLTLAVFHAGAVIGMVAWSATNWGRSIGLCFAAMLALDGLVLAGVISGEIHFGLHLNYWNGISLLQHFQAIICFALFFRNRAAKWATV